jgi:hypothetical protein
VGWRAISDGRWSWSQDQGHLHRNFQMSSSNWHDLCRYNKVILLLVRVANLKLKCCH